MSPNQAISILIFKNEEVGKMSAGGAHVWKVSEGELTNPPMLSSLCSLNIDAKYVFISLNTIIILEYYVVDGHYFVFFFLCVFS